MTVPMLERALKKEFGAFEQKMDRRFEKQEIMFEQRFQKMSEDLDVYFDRRFDKVSQEMRQHMEVLVEHTRAEVGEPYQDKLDLVAQKVDNHEERITSLEIPS